MKEQFVPYEIALKLKKLGFNDECFGYYSNEYNLEIGLPEKYTDRCHGNPKEGTYRRIGLISVPLYQQAFDWFRNNFNLSCHIWSGKLNDILFYGYDILDIQEQVRIIDNSGNGGGDCDYNTYEDARIECLKKLIEVVKSR